MRVFCCDHFEIPLPERHRFPISKYRLLREALLERGILQPAELERSRPIDRRELERVHSPAYLDAIYEGKLSEAEVRRLGFPWSPQLVLRSCASVFGTVAAARHALTDGIAGNLAGGTHHAFSEHGEGYCVFNDLAVAVRSLQAERRIERAVVVDLDVHQGNGTAAIFAGDDSVFTFSMHGEHNFPFRKTRSSRDVNLPDDLDDAGYLEALDRHLPEVLEAAGADILFFQAGVDPLEQDGLGRLSLSLEGLRQRDRRVLEAAWSRSLPVVLTLGGGYAKPLSLTVEAHAQTYEVAMEIFFARQAERIGGAWRQG